MCKRWKGIVEGYSSKLNKLLRSKKYYFKTCDSTVVPRSKGIYLIYQIGHSKRPLYVGIAKDLKRRLFHQHLKATGSQFATYCRREKPNLKNKIFISRYIKNNCFFRFMSYNSKKLECLESFTKAILRPKWMI